MASKKTVLVVEDEKDLAQVLKVKLEEAGFETRIAFNGESGLQIAFAVRPDLILLDVLLPGISGVEMLDKLRQYEWGKDVLVILLTNVDDLDTLSDVIADGACEYFVKTEWKLDDVIAKVKEKLNVS